jgi:hypothetical protein
MKNIVIHNPNNLPLIDYHQLVGIQGNLKTLSQENRCKIENSIHKFGWFIPFYVWNDKGTFRLIDGHGRLKYLTELQPLNSEFPYLLIDAQNMQEAKEKLLVISSQYHTINLEGFEEFTADLEKEFLDNATNFDALLKELENTEFEEVEPENVEVFPIIPIDKEKAERGEPVPTLSFGKYKINITQDELELLTQKFEDYTAKTKVSYGFVLDLLNPIQ